MSADKNKTINLHTVSLAAFLHELRRANTMRLARATQSYLICKATVLRRRAEIKERQCRGADYADLQRMVARLEASMRAHKAIVDELSADNGIT